MTVPYRSRRRQKPKEVFDTFKVSDTVADARRVDEPGAYLRENVARRTRSFWLLMTAYVAALLTATAVGLDGHPWLALVGWGAVGCFGIAANDTVNAAIPWIRGDRAETDTRAVLEELRREGYLVVNDVMFGGFGNLDHLVFGTHNVFLIETKASRYETRHLGRVKHQAKLLHDQVGTWVTPVLCAGNRRSKTYEHNRVLICGRNNVVDAIRAYAPREHVDPERVRSFVDRFAV